WDFGDGVGSSTAVSPTYTYASIGTYTVVLTATGPGGTDVVTGTHVVAPMAVNAAFSSNTPVTLGDTSVFTNMTTGTGPITYTWDFGDGVGTSTDTNPTYTYTSAGTYTITLTATGPGGTDVVTGTHVVVVTSYELYLPVILNTP
ncbi:MAG: PKD domain-containing protein, partial [Chloroflexi bacterium]|nr:PKD domain-containing protein [Chloroflexota bacterium]